MKTTTTDPVGGTRVLTLPASLLLVDKPASVSSHDVVNVARRATGERRIGHHGTLDPFATGLLVLLVGRATRLARFIDGEPRSYRATIRFGASTDTDDLDGTVVREAPLPDPAAVDAAIEKLTGRVMQLPPAFSAKQVGGVRAYAAARRGRPVELEPVPVQVHRWEVESRAPHELVARISCGTGTYIRSLARDLGELTGSAAHLTALRRLAAGPLDVGMANSMEQLRAGEATFLSPLVAITGMHSVTLDVNLLRDIAHGRPIPATTGAERVALVDGDGRVVAVASREGSHWKPSVVLVTPEELPLA